MRFLLYILYIQCAYILTVYISVTCKHQEHSQSVLLWLLQRYGVRLKYLWNVFR